MSKQTNLISIEELDAGFVVATGERVRGDDSPWNCLSMIACVTPTSVEDAVEHWLAEWLKRHDAKESA